LQQRNARQYLAPQGTEPSPLTRDWCASVLGPHQRLCGLVVISDVDVDVDPRLLDLIERAKTLEDGKPN